LATLVKARKTVRQAGMLVSVDVDEYSEDDDEKRKDDDDAEA